LNWEREKEKKKERVDKSKKHSFGGEDSVGMDKCSEERE
jgi:hypothetical protein